MKSALDQAFYADSEWLDCHAAKGTLHQFCGNAWLRRVILPSEPQTGLQSIPRRGLLGLVVADLLWRNYSRNDAAVAEDRGDYFRFTNLLGYLSARASHVNVNKKSLFLGPYFVRPLVCV